MNACVHLAAVALLASAAPAWSEERPFAPGEVLQYRVTFGALPVTGAGSLRVEAPVERAGEEAEPLAFDIEIQVMGQRVSHHARSWLALDRFESLGYQMVEHSPLGAGRASWAPRSPEANATALPLDELSFIYLMRVIPLPEKATLQLDRHYDPRRNPVRVRVVRREVRVVGGVPVRTVLVELRVKDPQRFPATGEGVLALSLTDDARRIPVRMELPSPLGPALVLELTSAAPPGGVLTSAR